MTFFDRLRPPSTDGGLSVFGIIADNAPVGFGGCLMAIGVVAFLTMGAEEHADIPPGGSVRRMGAIVDIWLIASM